MQNMFLKDDSIMIGFKILLMACNKKWIRWPESSPWACILLKAGFSLYNASLSFTHANDGYFGWL